MTSDFYAFTHFCNASMMTQHFDNSGAQPPHTFTVTCIYHSVCWWGIYRILRCRKLSLSLIFCCYQQVYDTVNTSCLWVTLQVRGCDGMSTPQNGAAAYTHSLTYHISARVVPVDCVFLSVLSYCRSSLTAEAFL